MRLTAKCLKSLKCRKYCTGFLLQHTVLTFPDIGFCIAFWETTDIPSLKKFLEFRFLAGDLESEEIEHYYYTHDLNTIGSHYAKVSEVGQKILKWKQHFKASVPITLVNLAY